MPINFSDQDKVIIDKIQSYCLYQDRCIKEVKNKLFSLKVNDDLGQKIINHLIDNDYLNEERFVKLFIQGKLRIKKWGKIKLKYELKIRGINNICRLSNVYRCSYRSNVVFQCWIWIQILKNSRL